MKNTVSFIILFSLLGLSQAQAQAYHGVKSYPIYKQGASIIKGLDDESKEIVRIEYDLIFSSKSTYRTLTSDWEYTIVGFADEGVKDFDMYLYEYDDLIEEWTMVMEGDSDDAYAVINYKPTITAQYMIEVIAREFNQGYSAARYGLVIFHD